MNSTGPRSNLFTSNQISAWKTRLHSESCLAFKSALESIEKFNPTETEGHPYMRYHTAGSMVRSISFPVMSESGFDRARQATSFDPKCRRDTKFPEYKRHREGLSCVRPILSSQLYGQKSRLSLSL